LEATATKLSKLLVNLVSSVTLLQLLRHLEYTSLAQLARLLLELEQLEKLVAQPVLVEKHAHNKLRSRQPTAAHRDTSAGKVPPALSQAE
jgi:hypothetical protein